jgi:hypothetical protein
LVADFEDRVTFTLTVPSEKSIGNSKPLLHSVETPAGEPATGGDGGGSGR